MFKSIIMVGALAALTPASIAIAAPAQTPEAPDNVHVVLEFTKAGDSASAKVTLDTQSCPACSQSQDPAFARNNAHATLLDLRLPARRHLQLAFTGDIDSVERVLLEKTELAFHRKDGRLLVEIPPLSSDLIDTGEFSTNIVEPGMVMRVEHLDPRRLAGYYASKPAPVRQRQAATNIEFAMREAVRELGLGDRVARQGLGLIEIMGFDTNYPHGHTDAPPHVHIHLRWPSNTGTQIGHLYMGADGRLETDKVGITGYGQPEATFGKGQRFTTIAHTGKVAYGLTITAGGGLAITTPGTGGPERTCTIEPGTDGFVQNARLACDDRRQVLIAAKDDAALGELVVQTGTIVEHFHYDTDTGKLLSPTEAPTVPASVIVPTATIHLGLPEAESGPEFVPATD